MAKYEGDLLGSGLSVGIVVSRFNELLSSRLLGGATDALTRHGVAEDDVDVAWVPGAFEIPLVAGKMAASGKYDFVLALGVVIRGGTPHFEYVCSSVTDGLGRVALDSGTPVGFGILTCDTLEQALDRSGGPGASEDKGREAAAAAMRTWRVLQEIAHR